VTADGSGLAWDVLGDTSRRQIVSVLAEGPRAVGELADRLPISRPAVSQHLRLLKDAGVVVDEVHGTRRVYRLDAAALSALKDQLDTFWRRALAGFSEVAETTIQNEQRRRKSERHE
jgi:DNA-binding transcriptional ArsR family regulator